MPIAAAAVEIAPGIVAETARRFFANRLSVVGLIVSLLIIGVAILADVLAPYPRDFADFSQVLQTRARRHPLGTDAVGRDFLSRILYGARTSMIVGLTVPLLAALIGIPMGAVGGLARRPVRRPVPARRRDHDRDPRATCWRSCW